MGQTRPKGPSRSRGSQRTPGSSWCSSLIASRRRAAGPVRSSPLWGQSPPRPKGGDRVLGQLPFTMKLWSKLLGTRTGRWSDVRGEFWDTSVPLSGRPHHEKSRSQRQTTPRKVHASTRAKPYDDRWWSADEADGRVGLGGGDVWDRQGVWRSCWAGNRRRARTSKERIPPRRTCSVPQTSTPGPTEGSNATAPAYQQRTPELETRSAWHSNVRLGSSKPHAVWHTQA